MTNTTDTPFETRVVGAIHEAVVAWTAKGDWIAGAWQNRSLNVDIRPLIREVWSRVDRDRLLERLTDKVEDRIAQQVFASLATELNTDIKKVMSDTDFRAEVRVLVKAKLRERGHL